MRRSVLTILSVATAGLLASGCALHHRHTATTPTRPTLPRIHEGFTVLPCPRRPSTTLDMEGCAEHKIVRTDAAIETRARAVFSLLNSKGRRAFANAERSWLAYRRAACTAESSKYEGGSIEPVVFGLCVTKQNGRHLMELAALEHALRSP